MRIVRWEHRCKCARCLGRLAAGTQDVENTHHGHAGGAGKLLLLFQVLHAAICSMQPCHVIVHEALLACARTSTASSSLRLLTRGFQLCTQRDRAHPAQRRNLGCDALRDRELVPSFPSRLIEVTPVPVLWDYETESERRAFLRDLAQRGPRHIDR